ncbi:MAG: prolyl oligopeptidase family serine peptidase [Bacteroidetes bacterium]|nr:prolyl oligopeptidase family serine peptidase [Bacteroidota bacterium]
MKKLSLLLLACFMGTFAFGQKADFQAAARYSSSNISRTVGSTSVRANWLKDSDKFWYSYKTGDGKLFWLVDPAKKTKEPLFDVYYMTSEINQKINKILNHLDLSLSNLKFKDDNSAFNFEVDSIKFEYDMKTKAVTIVDTIDSKAKAKERKENAWKGYNKDSTFIVYAKDYNLYIMKADDPDSTEYQLTTTGEKKYSFGGGYRDDDTTKNKKSRAYVRWLEDEKTFYVTRRDSRKVKDLWVLNVLKKPRPELETYKYAMPGDEFVPQSELWFFSADTKEGFEVDVDKYKDQTISVYPIKERSDEVYFVRTDRTVATKDVCLINTETGELKELFSETDEPYWHSNSTLAVVNSGKDLLWWSERTGWGQYYLYDSQGNLKNQITKGNFIAGRITQIDTLGRSFIFSGVGREKDIHPYYAMNYKVDFDGSGFQLLTPEDATHSIRVSKSDDYLVDTYSRADMAPKSVLRDTKGNLLLELEETDLRRLYETGWKMPEIFKVKAVDGVTNLYGIMWTPLKMEEGRKYPIINYVYPGPQVESFSMPWSSTGRGSMALAQMGFVTVAMGHRGGSPLRSKYYHTYGYDNLRDYALPDDKYGLEQLADRYDFIDISKVGIHGHSGGGFMSTAAILTYPDFYDVAVSSAGNHDNNIYNLWWGETHHGVKEVKTTVKKKKSKDKDGETENDTEEVIKDGIPWPEDDSLKEEEEVKITFKSKVPANQDLAKNLKGHLLLIHGDIDNNVHPGNTTRVADALIAAGKRFDYMVMPGQRHGFGKYSKYKEQMMWYYFAEHLLGDYRNNVEIYNPDE